MKTTIVREVVIGDPITDEQRESSEVATTCPVARWLYAFTPRPRKPSTARHRR
jgi:hypothetical protein